jgi:transcriptional regulator with GAF, ATPase, and Fis domain
VEEFTGTTVFNHPELEAGFQFMLGYYGRPDTSALVQLLEVEGQKLGALVLLAEGRDRFSESHRRLFSLLKEPCAIALSNTLRHQEVLRLKDLLADDNRYLQRELLHLTGDEIVGEDFGLKKVMNMVRQVAPRNSPVLLFGETGAGKDVIANSIHYSSPRKDGPFVKVNCGAIPETLLDSELFGHEKGAFTGATAAREGRWKAAHGGTLMLDEVGELPLPLQAKLLRALQDGTYSPLGSDLTEQADVRVLAATNRDLEEEIAARRFREDLYYRLNVVEIHLPALRERTADIAPMARRFAAEFCGEPARISPATERVLQAYAWPGNVRELRNVLARSCLMARGGVILPEHLPPRVRCPPANDRAAAAATAGAAPGPVQTLADSEKQRILAALAHCGGNRTRAAQLLGIGRRTLIYRLKSYDSETAHTGDPPPTEAG